MCRGLPAEREGCRSPGCCWLPGEGAGDAPFPAVGGDWYSPPPPPVAQLCCTAVSLPDLLCPRGSGSPLPRRACRRRRPLRQGSRLRLFGASPSLVKTSFSPDLGRAGEGWKGDGETRGAPWLGRGPQLPPLQGVEVPQPPGEVCKSKPRFPALSPWLDFSRAERSSRAGAGPSLPAFA